MIEISHRRALCRASARASGLASYMDASGDLAGSAVVCVDSAGRISLTPEGEVSGLDDMGTIDLLIIEEIEQVSRHIVSEDRIRSGRSGAIWTALRRIVGAAARILCLDADCGPLTVGMLTGLLGTMPAYKMEKISALPTPKTAIIAPPGAWGEAGMRIRLRTLIDNRTKPILIFCTGRKKAKEIEKIAKDFGVDSADLLLFHGHNSSGLPQKALAEDPSRVARYRVVIHTTALGSGIDITTDCHLLAYVDASAGPIADDILQGISRCRPAKTAVIHVYGSPRVGEADCDPAEHRRLLYARSAGSERVLRALLTDRTDPLTMTADPALVSLYCHVRAYEASQSWLADRYGAPAVEGTADHPPVMGPMVSEGALARHLAAHGWTVDRAQITSADPVATATTLEVDACAAALVAASQAVRAADHGRILDAPDLSDAEAGAYAGREIGEDLRAALMRHELSAWYGRTPDEALLVREARGWRSQCRALADLVVASSPGEALRVADRDADARARGAIGAGDRTLRAASMRRILSLCGISDLLAGGTITPPAIQAEDEIRRIAWEIFTLDRIRKLPFYALIGRLLEKFGIRTRSTRVRTPQGRARVYTIDLDALDLALADSAAAIDRLRGVSAIAETPLEVMPTLADPGIDGIELDAILAMEAA
ncbi:MAG: hypothetical protein IPK72_08820 [Candidatus Eisenbacteria bacterium]|nr:hypothetical protein [Candidatus Eisenbacteria bacterium]